ncbi:MAG: hypothetical protein P8N76_16300 [Pirellulaceae bacterium]|nr:hypothetical protein [Pirellulaceae bacterium]
MFQNTPKSSTSFLIVAFISFLNLASGAEIGVISDFQSGSAEGWTNERALEAIQIKNGGPNGADDKFLFVESTGTSGAGSRMATRNESTAWEGDYSGVTAVEVDLMNPTDSPELEMRLVLFGPSVKTQRWTSDLALIVPNDGLWRHYSFPVDEESIVRVLGNADYEEMLNDVQFAMLRHDEGRASSRGTAIAATLGFDNIELVGLVSLLGDFDGSGVVDVQDVDLLLQEVQRGRNEPSYDLNADNLVNRADIQKMLNSPEILNSYIGDANLDGIFDSSDFVFVFQGGVYEDAIPGNATWATGDWDGDGDFTTSDFTFAFQEGGYDQGARPQAFAVPEPSSIVLACLGFLVLLGQRQNRR